MPWAWNNSALCSIASSNPSAAAPGDGVVLAVEQVLTARSAKVNAWRSSIPGQRARAGAEHVEHPESGRADLQRKREDRAHTLIVRRRRVRRPPVRRPVHQIWHKDRPARRERVDARPFAEDELEFLDPFAGRVGGRRDAPGAVLGHHAHPGARGGQRPHRRTAQPLQRTHDTVRGFRRRLPRQVFHRPGDGVAGVAH